MRQFALMALVAVLTCGHATAQSDLVVSGTLASGGDLTLTVNSAPANSPTAFLAGDAGSTSLFGGLVTVGLNPGFIPLAIGQTDNTGSMSRTYNLPPSMIGMSFTFSAQALSVDLSGGVPTGTPGMIPTLSFVASDVESITLML